MLEIDEKGKKKNLSSNTNAHSLAGANSLHIQIQRLWHLISSKLRWLTKN